jgi:hypothetical protein
LPGAYSTTTQPSEEFPIRYVEPKRSVHSSRGKRSRRSPPNSGRHTDRWSSSGQQPALRPAELFGLERRDLDFRAGVVYVRRAYANGKIKDVKTRRSRRAVPLQTIALEALKRLPDLTERDVLFPGPRGNHIDLRNFRRRNWKPALIAAGVHPSHQPYDLRHTYATFALRADVPVSRFMGPSIAMIDLHYGHLAHDGREHAVALLDNLAAEKAVDARWTLAAVLGKRLRSAQSRPRQVVLTTPGGRLVDGAQKMRHHANQKTDALSRRKAEAL